MLPYQRIIKCLLKETYSGFERADFVGWLHTNEESFELMYSKNERMEVTIQLSRLRGLTDSIKTSGFKSYLSSFFEEHNLVLTAVACSGLLKLDTQLSGNLPLERSVHYEEKTHV